MRNEPLPSLRRILLAVGCDVCADYGVVGVMNEMPNCPRVEHCHCYPDEERQARERGTTHCVCGESEKALRGWSNGCIVQPMTTAQREWCLTEIDNVEGHDREDYEKASDAELARYVLDAWVDYCRDKGLL